MLSLPRSGSTSPHQCYARTDTSISPELFLDGGKSKLRILHPKFYYLSVFLVRLKEHPSSGKVGDEVDEVDQGDFT